MSSVHSSLYFSDESSWQWRICTAQAERLSEFSSGQQAGTRKARSYPDERVGLHEEAEGAIATIHEPDVLSMPQQLLERTVCYIQFLPYTSPNEENAN